MARLLLDQDPIVLTPHRSRSHLSDLAQIGVAHGFDTIHGHDHVVPASAWRFDREVDRDETHPSGESLVRPEFELAPGTTSVTAHCRLPGFVAIESCYPAPQGQPITHFRHRFMSLWVTTDEDVLKLSLKPHYLPEQLVFMPFVSEADPMTAPQAQSITLPAEEWTTFFVHRFDQTITSFAVGRREYDVDDAGFRPVRNQSRYQRVRRGII